MTVTTSGWRYLLLAGALLGIFLSPARALAESSPKTAASPAEASSLAELQLKLAANECQLDGSKERVKALEERVTALTDERTVLKKAAEDASKRANELSKAEAADDKLRWLIAALGVLGVLWVLKGGYEIQMKYSAEALAHEANKQHAALLLKLCAVDDPQSALRVALTNLTSHLKTIDKTMKDLHARIDRGAPPAQQ